MRILATLEHPGVARLLDSGVSSSGLPYIIIEYVDGQPIDAHCAAKKLPIAERVALLLQACDALAYIHSRGVLHLDLKPPNVLVTANGQLKLLDFGIARAGDLSSAALPLTTPGEMTPRYASPEQIASLAVDARSDVYSLGMLLWKVATGNLPGEPGFRRTAVPEDLASIAERSTETNPRDRYQSIEQLSDDLQRFRAGRPVSARAASPWGRAARYVTRNRRLSAGAALALTLLVAGAAALAWHMEDLRRHDREPAVLLRRLRASMVSVNDALKDLPTSTSLRRELLEGALKDLEYLRRQGIRDRRFQIDLASTYERLGDLRARLPPEPGLNPEEPLNSYAHARAILEPLWARNPGDREIGEMLAANYRETGLFLADSQAADEALGKAVAICKELVRSGWGDAASLRSLAWAHEKRGLLQHFRSDFRGAELSLETEANLIREAQAMDPGGWHDEFDLESATAGEAWVFEDAGDNARAQQLLREAVRHGKLALERVATTVGAEYTEALLHLRLGDHLYGLGEYRAAGQNYGECVDQLAPLMQAEPADSQMRGDLAVCYFGLAKVKTALNDAITALRYHERALQLRRQRAQDAPGNIWRQWEFADSANCTAALLAPAHKSEARELYRAALAASQRGLEVSKTHLGLQRQALRAREALSKLG